MKSVIPRFVTVFAVLLTAAHVAFAAYPDRPVRIVVISLPGGAADLMARTIGARLSEQLKQSFVVENRPGGSSLVGSESVARAAPDGYSLLLFNQAQTGSAALSPKFPLDLLRDFAPVSMLGTTPNIIAVSNAFPARTIQEFVALAKSNPGKINYGSVGYGSPSHLAIEILSSTAGIQLTHVPYKGQAAYAAALATDEIQIALGTVPGFVGLANSGRLRPFAAAGLKAPKEFPNLPTLNENGFPGFDLDIWFSLVATAGTPPEVIKLLNDEIRSALNDPAVRADMDKKGFVPKSSTPEELGAHIKADLERWKGIVKAAKLTDPAEAK